MRKLIAICGLLLSVSAAHAQTEKASTVTKLPGEESLSLRERAERDFLMPVRRKKIVVEAPKASADDVTASPETDVTAHYAAAADEVRSEEAAAPVHETHIATRSRASRHAAWVAARRARLAEARAEERRSATRHSKAKASSHKSKAKTAHSKVKTKTKTAAKSSKSKVSKKSTATKKSSTHKAAKKVTTHKASASKKRHR